MRWLALAPDLTPLRGPGAGGFRAIFASRTVAYLGSQAAEVALLVQAQRITGSPLVVGTLGLAELVPLVVFGLYGGVLADRLDRRALMRWCEPGLAGCAVLLMVNALLPHPLLWPLYVIAALIMALASLQRPAFEAATPRVVRPGQLTAATAALSMSTSASVLAGSSLGGVLAAAPGPWLVYGLDAAGFLISFVLLSRLPPLPALAGEHATADGPALRELLTGLRYAVTRPDLLGSYLADLSAMIFAYPNAMLPFLAEQLHAPWSTGLMFAAPSAGALVFGLTSGWMTRVRRHGRGHRAGRRGLGRGDDPGRAGARRLGRPGLPGPGGRGGRGERGVPRQHVEAVHPRPAARPDGRRRAAQLRRGPARGPAPLGRGGRGDQRPLLPRVAAAWPASPRSPR